MEKRLPRLTPMNLLEASSAVDTMLLAFSSWSFSKIRGRKMEWLLSQSTSSVPMRKAKTARSGMESFPKTENAANRKKARARRPFARFAVW